MRHGTNTTNTFDAFPQRDNEPSFIFSCSGFDF